MIIKKIIQNLLAKRKRQKEKEEVNALIKQMKEQADNDKDIYFIGTEKSIKLIQEIIMDKDIKYKVLPDSYFSDFDFDSDKVYMVVW